MRQFTQAEQFFYFMSPQSGGGSPIVPGGYAIRLVSYSVSRMGLVTGDNLNSWQSEPPPTLSVTQATSGNQPTLFEYDVVKQSTLANQPTYDYDKVVTQDASANQPVVSASGLDFRLNGGSAKYIDGRIGQSSGDFTCRLKYNNRVTAKNARAINYSDGSRFVEIRLTDNQVFIGDDAGGFASFLGLSFGASGEVSVKLDGTDMTVSDGTTELTQDITGQTFSKVVGRISSNIVGNDLDGIVESVEYWNSAVADQTSIVETPDSIWSGTDLSTMRKDDGTSPQVGDQVQGWWATDAELAMQFNSGDNLSKFAIGNDFSIAVEFSKSDLFNAPIVGRLGGGARIQTGASNGCFLFADDGTSEFFTTPSYSVNTKTKIEFRKNGNNVTLYVDDVEQQTKDLTGKTYNSVLNNVCSESAFATTINIFSLRTWSSSDSSGDPNFELLPQASLMRNSANATPVLGDSISAWLSTTHKPYQNEVRKDGNNTYMIGLPTQSGDFSYIFKEIVDIQAQDKRTASSSTTSAEIGFDASEQLYVIADDGTRYTFTGVTNSGTEKIWIPWREGNTLGVYDGYVEDAQTFDVTGKTFTIDQWGAPSLSSNGYGKEPTVYSFKVDQTQANWWSYVRLEDGTIVLDGNGNPQLPSVPVAVNSFNFNGTDQSLNGSDILNAGTADIFSGTVRFKTSNSNSQQIMTKVNTSVNQDYYYTQIVTGGKFKIGFSLGMTNAYVVSTNNSFSDGDWHVAVFTLVRSTKTMTIEIDGVNQAFTVDINQGSLVGTQSNTHDFLIADRDVDDNFIFDGSISFAGLSFGTDLLAFSSELAQSDAKCYDDFTQPLKDAFATADYFDCATYNGRTELQARTGRANGNVLTNVNNTPLTGTGLNVECNS